MIEGPFDAFDATEVMESAIRRYWDSEIASGSETIPYDDLDPVRRHEVREQVLRVAPHIIGALKASLIQRAPIAVPDVIPDYFFGAE